MTVSKNSFGVLEVKKNRNININVLSELHLGDPMT